MIPFTSLQVACAYADLNYAGPYSFKLKGWKCQMTKDAAGRWYVVIL